MVYATYTQTATKIAKQNNTLIYSAVPVGQYESDNIVDVLNVFTDNLNKMAGKDRLHIVASVKTTDNGDIVICAEYVPNDESAKIAKVVFE